MSSQHSIEQVTFAGRRVAGRLRRAQRKAASHLFCSSCVQMAAGESYGCRERIELRGREWSARRSKTAAAATAVAGARLPGCELGTAHGKSQECVMSASSWTEALNGNGKSQECVPSVGAGRAEDSGFENLTSITWRRQRKLFLTRLLLFWTLNPKELELFQSLD